ncbi:aminoglycoside phosphotransferase family protein [Clostridium sp. D2Q-11]|uniref:Aminoglycoside phosphotransferase family protein n=1 Tax=Anaeromonas frigoriresistens TaxID=2683708 RepID=A0A942Z9D3_9FIRM|nr:aminoglycoside phosphotransferase family protein [Anaeromonas frigoriresistens]MBS4539004.1 aminoglycoside phosphotransferase family protein [Anaeromonas frigoriresistens]
MSNKTARLYDYIDIDIKMVHKIFAEYDSKIKINKLELIPEGLSTSNYIVHTNEPQIKYLLKIYPENGGNSEIEVSSYKYAKRYVVVPNIYFFDNTKKVYNKPYIIMDYIDGITLKEYIIKNKRFPEKMVYNIANSLALLHNREYENRALLDKHLNIEKVLPSIKAVYEKGLNSFAGNHINSKIKKDILEFITQNEDMLKKLDSQFVYSHGDFNPSNILVDNKESIWFIDFEYSLSSSIYLDIGKFFRDRTDIDKYMTKEIYDNFFRGYNSSAKILLTNDWIKLVRLMDMISMLGLINKKSVPDEWVSEIEEAIIKTMSILGD